MSLHNALYKLASSNPELKLAVLSVCAGSFSKTARSISPLEEEIAAYLERMPRGRKIPITTLARDPVFRKKGYTPDKVQHVLRNMSRSGNYLHLGLTIDMDEVYVWPWSSKQAYKSRVAEAVPPGEGEADQEEDSSEPEEKRKQRKGPPPRWDEFMKEKYQGGKAKVQNPNAKTRKNHPQVSVSTALKVPSFMTKVLKEYGLWLKGLDAKPSKGGKPSPKKETKKPSKKDKEPEPAGPLKELQERLAFGSLWDRKSLNEEQKRSFRMYSSVEYRPINAHLRHGYSDPGAAKLAEQMNSAMNPPKGVTPKAVKAFREADANHPLYQMIQAGEIGVGASFVDKGFMSTTLDPGYNFTGDTDAIRFEIDVPKGTPGMYVGTDEDSYQLSKYGDEDELILKAGTSVTITEIEKSERYVLVRCKITPK